MNVVRDVQHVQSHVFCGRDDGSTTTEQQKEAGPPLIMLNLVLSFTLSLSLSLSPFLGTSTTTSTVRRRPWNCVKKKPSPSAEDLCVCVFRLSVDRQTASESHRSQKQRDGSANFHPYSYRR